MSFSLKPIVKRFLFHGIWLIVTVVYRFCNLDDAGSCRNQTPQNLTCFLLKFLFQHLCKKYHVNDTQDINRINITHPTHSFGINITQQFDNVTLQMGSDLDMIKTLCLMTKQHYSHILKLTTITRMQTCCINVWVKDNLHISFTLAKEHDSLCFWSLTNSFSIGRLSYCAFWKWHWRRQSHQGFISFGISSYTLCTNIYM